MSVSQMSVAHMTLSSVIQAASATRSRFETCMGRETLGSKT